MAHTSFMSEHTAEYALVNEIVRILSRRYSSITPIYLWLSREGSSNAVRSLAHRHFKVVAVYPRRPKVQSPGSGSMRIKFNNTVLIAAREYHNRGIPVLMGSPLVSDLASFRTGTSCTWFRLAGHDSPTGDWHATVALGGELIESLPERSPIAGPLDHDSIISYVSSSAIDAEWPEWLRTIRETRKSSRFLEDRSFLWFGRTYKPFYLLLDVASEVSFVH